MGQSNESQELEQVLSPTILRRMIDVEMLRKSATPPDVEIPRAPAVPTVRLDNCRLHALLAEVSEAMLDELTKRVLTALREKQ